MLLTGAGAGMEGPDDGARGFVPEGEPSIGFEVDGAFENLGLWSVVEPFTCLGVSGALTV